MNTIFKRAYFVGLAGYIALLVLALVYYKERTIFTDTSFLLFHICRTQSFSIQVMRFGAVCTQIFPLLSFKAGLTLNHVMMIESMSFVIFNLLCYIACGWGFKRYDLAILLLFYNILFASDTFYWVQSELLQGIALMIVCFACMCSPRKFAIVPFVYLLLGVGIITIAFFHPLILFPFYYTTAFLLLKKDVFTRRKLLYGAAVLFAVALAVKNIAFPNAYDAKAMEGNENFINFFPDYFSLRANKHFLHLCMTKYFWIPVIIALNIAFYYRSKQFGKLHFFFWSTIVYILLIDITHPSLDVTGFYIESFYLSISIFIGLPFILDVMPVLAKRNLAVPITALIIITGCARIYMSAGPFVTRLNWERNMLKINGAKKLVIHEPLVPMDTLMMTWGMPYEFWLLSTVESGKTASITVIDNIKQYDWAFGDKKSFICFGQVLPYADLPKRYFHFTDTTIGYTLIK